LIRSIKFGGQADMETLALPLLIGLVFVALAFDFINGLHDAANSIATVVSTRVLPRYWAVAWASFFNFIAFLFFGLNVASTVGTGLVSPDVTDARVVFGALIGAIVWNLITWWAGLPSSSSHALIGGLVGAGLAKAGLGSIVWSGLGPTALAIVFSPLLGFVLALLLILITSWMFVKASPHFADQVFRKCQLVSAALYSLGHGSNDAQKTMGIIAVLLYSQGILSAEFSVPFWVVLTCQAAMALGTLVGGWPHDGYENHALDTHARLLRRDRGWVHSFLNGMAGHSSLDNAYDHRRNRWCRCSQTHGRGALERGGRYPHCLGVDDSRIRINRSAGLCGSRAIRLVQ
jgi:PiT family inorganic phosphate transporter